jgi:N-acetylglutamate synthase
VPVGDVPEAEVGALQERAASAIPATVAEDRGGDLLRVTDSAATWWAGASLLHAAAPERDLASRVHAAEAFAGAHGARACVQVCPGCPPGLDAVLAARGYAPWGDLALRAATTTDVAARVDAPALRVDVADEPGPGWWDVLTAGQGVTPDPADRRMLRRVARPRAYLTAHAAGRGVAVGRAVADDGWAGVFAMATRPEARGRGEARAVLARLAGWAQESGCPRLYLQVTDDTPAAARLYARAGFTEVARYHYRLAGGRARRKMP